MQPIPPPPSFQPPKPADTVLPLIEAIEPIDRNEDVERENVAEARRRMFQEGARPGGTTLAVVLDEEYDFRPIIKPLLDLDRELLDQLRECLSQPEECLVFVQSLCELNKQAKPLVDFFEFLQAVDRSLAKKLLSQTLNALEPVEDVDDAIFECLYKHLQSFTRDGTLFTKWRQLVELYTIDPDQSKKMSQVFLQDEDSERFAFLSLVSQMFCLQEAKAIEKVLKQPHIYSIFSKYPNVATACAAYVIQEKCSAVLQQMLTTVRALTSDCFVHIIEISKTLYYHTEVVRSLYTSTAHARRDLYRILKNPDATQQRAYFEKRKDNPVLSQIVTLFAQPFGIYLNDVLENFLCDDISP